MKIESFDLDLSSTRTYSESYTKAFTREHSFSNIMDTRMEQVEAWKNQVVENHSTSSDTPETQGDIIETSSYFRRTSQWFNTTKVGDSGMDAVSMSETFQQELEKMREIMASIMSALENMMIGGVSANVSQFRHILAMPVQQSVSWGFSASWQTTETQTFTYEESEQTKVSADGMVKTADGKEIDFDFSFAMDRSFLREDSVTWTESGYVLMDPLVIRTDADAPMLSGAQFSFDLDLDGVMEDLPEPGPGMGFLALDLNEDGEINDGSELFGPTTGYGFEELAAYDEDENGWIDENDDVFDELFLWEGTESGGMQMSRLKDTGIGAIYLGAVESSFDMTTDENEMWARVSSTSIALTEEGGVLPVQEMDYTV